MLDHVIPLKERQLRQLLREYVSYYNEDAFTMPSIKMLRIGD